jgi:hypothetical protein
MVLLPLSGVLTRSAEHVQTEPFGHTAIGNCADKFVPSHRPPAKERLMSRINPPTSSQNYTFNNVAYVQLKGQFQGRTPKGAFAVPYEIVTPANPAQGNRTFVFEPPHFSGGPVAREAYLGAGFLFNRGFSHASVGYSNINRRILEPNPGFPLVIGNNPVEVIPPGRAGEVTDYHILREFAQTLKQSPPPFVGRVERIYGIGFSDSGNAVHHVYGDFGHKSFDISFACTASFRPPVKPAGAKPIMVFNTEADFGVQTVPDPAFPNYRWYAVAGGPHVPDNLRTRTFFNSDPPPPGPGFNPPAPSKVEGTTPLDWVPFIKALFVAGDEWARSFTQPAVIQPPPSAVLKVVPGGLFARDVAGNALGGIRHPALEFKEATFIASVVRGRRWENFGGYRKLRQFPDFDGYKRTFMSATEKLFRARLLLKADQDVLNRRAGLHPPDTFTMNYLWERFYTSPTRTDEDALMP